MSSALTSSSRALDALEECLKGILLHTGSALSNASQSRGGTLDTTRIHVDRDLPDFLKRWHASLNCLEGELVDAKATLHRQLAASQRKKSPEIVEQIDHASPPVAFDSDIVMVEAPTEENEVEKQEDDSDETKSQSKDKTADSDELKPEPQAPQSSPKVPEAEETQNDDTPANAPENKSPEIANASAEKHTPSHLIDLELGPSPKITASQSHSPLTTVEQASRFADLDEAGAALSNADVGSLLPGLIDYANGIGGGNGDVADNGAFAKPSALSQPEPASNPLDAPDIFGNSGGDSDLFGGEFMDNGTFDFGDFATNDNDDGNGNTGSTFNLFDADFFTLTNDNDG